MLRKSANSASSSDLFRERLEGIIDLKHRLCRLSRLIDWDDLERDFADYFCHETGRPAHSLRLSCGLLLLKEIVGVSDEEVVASWAENPYWQYFCGEEYFQHKFPMDASNLVHFRHRIGESGCERLLAETIRIGLAVGVVDKKDLECVTVDTTVQEKAVRYPTDVHLYHKAREELVLLAEEYDLKLRQNYRRLSKHSRFMANRYSSARQGKRAKKKIKNVKNYLGRVIRDIERKIDKNPALAEHFAEALEKANRIFTQQRKDKNKLYSWHAPEVECIAKGKAHKKYEFGCKAGFASTNKSNFLVGAQALHGNPYDGHTLENALSQIKKLTGIMPRRTHVDQGYKGNKVTESNVIIARQKRGITRKIKREMKRRNAIEPIIGHMKNDPKTGPKNHLKGKIGDKINALLMATGFNLRKILRHILSCLFQIIKNIEICVRTSCQRQNVSRI